MSIKCITFRDPDEKTPGAEEVIRDSISNLEKKLSEYYHQEVKIVTTITNEKK